MHSSPESRSLDGETLPLLAELVAGGNAVLIRVSGQSMWPTLVAGDTVELGAADAVEVGQLVLLHGENDRPLLHRIVELEEGADGQLWVQTRGDALVGSDPWVPRSQVIARVVRVEPRGALGRWAALLRGVAGRWAAVRGG